MIKHDSNKHPILILALLLLVLLISSCSAASGTTSSNPRSSNDPDPTADGGGVGLPGEEPEEPDPGDENTEGGDLGPVPLDDPCAVSTTGFLFNYEYERVVWQGPPRVEVRPGGMISQLQYAYDPEKQEGTLFLPNPPAREVTLNVTWPECRSDVFVGKTTYTPVVTGTCKGGQINLNVSERWSSVTLEIPCEADSEICGEDPCVFPYPLPFAFAGEQGVNVKFMMDMDKGTCTPDKITLPFMGVGAEGEKWFRLTCGD